jgi:hypothetical protein
MELLKNAEKEIKREKIEEWITFLFPILEVPGLNLDPEICYPNSGFSWFSLLPPAK